MNWLEVFTVLVVHAFDRAPGWAWSLVVEIADRLDWLFLVTFSTTVAIARRLIGSSRYRVVSA